MQRDQPAGEPSSSTLVKWAILRREHCQSPVDLPRAQQFLKVIWNRRRIKVQASQQSFVALAVSREENRRKPHSGGQ